ncbi:MAG TPA: DNA polymerase III subunit beta [Bryobacteraceae bacterium]|nr:DNA polymerase III subunit beta [Bryobacteraceae bacterium]HPT27094.1 DNA polymerase III subunit beta [Bryobacteraceae bacterium]
MEFTVSKADLVRELNLSQGVVEKKATIPILANILVEAIEDRLILTATDLELGIRSTTAARVKSAGTGTIPAKRLLDYVRLLPDADIQVKVSDTHWASLTCGRSRSRIAGMSRESYPELPEMPETSTRISLQALTNLIQKTIFSISNEDSRFTLNGALLQLQDGGMTMVATDGHRLALAHQPGCTSDAASSKALLPRKAMVELQKLAAEAGTEDEQIDYAADDNHLFFRLGGRLLMSRKLTGNFPDYERVLPRSHAHSITMNREELRGTIERVAQFADERTRAIKIQLADNEAKVHSSLSETGESEESLGVDYIGPTVEIGFNAQYLLEFLRAVPEPEVSFHFKDGQSAGELRPAGEGLAYEYRYVVMPMRI